jgi:hypothetical protein
LRTVEDAQRSVQRYIAAALGDGWEVRLWADEGALTTVPAIDANGDPIMVQDAGGQWVQAVRLVPTVIVRLNGPTSTTGSAWDQTVTQIVTLYVYPEPGDTESESSIRATRVQDVLQSLISQGIADGVMVGWPWRVPLWDFDGIGLWDDAEPTRGERDYVRVLPPLSFNRTHDPQDERRVIVTGDLRLSWGRALVPVAPLATVQSVTVRQHPS